MVTQEHWEDKIQTDIPYASLSPFGGGGSVWGDSVTPSLSRQISIGRGIGDSSSTAGGITDHRQNSSLFPIDNYELIYNRWEDSVILDSEAVQHIPQPSLAQIDPNDPNFIIGIPEEPPALPGDKDARKVNSLAVLIWF